MNRKYRLTGSTDFKRVRRNGKSYAHPLVILVTCPNAQEEPRFGFTAGKSLGNAVKRNRAKRLLREALRRNLADIQGGWDAILIARPQLIEKEWAEVQRAVTTVLKRAGMIEEEHNERA
jgi:ribonuclease P protein component